MAAATAEAARMGIPLTLHAGTVPYGGRLLSDTATAAKMGAHANTVILTFIQSFLMLM
jgi:hypothetical protein